MPKLTKRAVDALQPGPADVFAWDSELRGLGVRVKPSGIKSWVLKYRVYGKWRRVTIGRFPTITAERIRDKALVRLAAASEGKDLATEQRRGITVSEALDRFQTQHIDGRVKASTAKEYKRLIEARIRPALGRYRVDAVKTADIIEFHQSMSSAPRSANQAIAITSKLFSLAELWDVRPTGSNPCRGIQRFPETKRSRFYSDDELKRIGEAITALENDKGILSSAANAIRVLALSGCRLSEILTLRWENIDAQRSLLRLGDSKTGERSHSIGAVAMATLTAIPRIENSPWVFHGADWNAPLSVSTAETAWKAIRDRAKIIDGRLHDLRHTVGTYAAQTGAGAFLVRDKLGHRTIAMTSRYVERDADPLRALSEKVEKRIAAAMNGGTNGDVIPLKRPAKRQPRAGVQ